MKKNKSAKSIKLVITVAIILGFVWFLVVSPMITFHKNEKALENAARRYFELNKYELPTGERVKTVTLNTLYHQSYLKEDVFIPYTHKTCSIENSWVKVRKENNEYKYYTYLECGLLSSNVDHKGPEIKLNDKDEMIVGIGEEFKDPGIRSVVDNNDGKMKTEEVTVKSNVNTSEVGSYEVTYTAFDNLSNKTVVTRKVQVVQRLNSTIKGILKNTSHFVEEPDNNYIRLSNMLFQVYGIDGDNNITIVAAEDVANVSYSKLDKWLEYYYNHLNEYTQKAIIEREFCNMKVSDTVLDTTQCNGYTKKKKIYVPSIIEINSAGEQNNFMKTGTMSWTANTKGNSEAYVVRNIFFDEDYGKRYVSYNVSENFGVRPMMTVDGGLLISGGSGTRSDPFVFEDTKKARGGTYVNERFTGEYVSINGSVYRIIEVEKDGTTKVISNNTVGDGFDSVITMANPGDDKIVYNPKVQGSVGYFMNNRVAEYVDTSHFANHEVEVPIYKKEIIYGEEVSTEKYKVKVSAPNMFDMFSAQTQGDAICYSYWLINSSKASRKTGAISDAGVVISAKIPDYLGLNVRVVGYLKKDTIISSGAGTYESPYIIK